MSKQFKLLIWTIAILSFIGCRERTKPMTDTDLRRKAEKLAHEYILVDTHQDTPYRLLKKMENISVQTETGCFDYPRAKQGGLDAVFMAAYVPASYENQGKAKSCAENGIHLITNLARDYPEKFIISKSVEDVTVQFSDNRISIVIAIENGSALEGNIENLQYFYDLGVRYITLTHSECNTICDSSFDKNRKWNGLSPFGRQVIAEMNSTGMMIDASHASDEAFYQILELSKAPVVATHSSCRHFTPGWERNMSDDIIKLLAQKGGVIQINFGSMFINTDANQKFTSNKENIMAYIEENNLQDQAKDEFAEQYMAENPIGYGDISDVVAHIDHVVKLVGIDYVGIGSDFDGVGDTLPRELKDVSAYPNLIFELLKKGYSEYDIKKICSGNILRVWAEVERIGREI